MGTTIRNDLPIFGRWNELGERRTGFVESSEQKQKNL
eukprot:SAG31_NODE_46698_length_253_cov_0.701299_1_plen_36_part_01